MRTSSVGWVTSSVPAANVADSRNGGWPCEVDVEEMDLPIPRDQLPRAVEQGSRVEESIAVPFEDASARDPQFPSRGRLGQHLRRGTAGHRLRDLREAGLGTEVREELRQDREVGSSLGRLAQQ